MKSIIVTMCILAFTAFASKAQTTATPAASASTAEITFEKVEHDYGTINKGGDPNCEFKFKNTGKEPLILTDVKSSCGCTIPAWSKEPILPGKSGSIKVRYATERIGAIDKSITVLSNAKNSPVVLHIKGLILDTPAPAASPDKK